MADDAIRHYDVYTDFGQMVFDSDSDLGYWWERIHEIGGAKGIKDMTNISDSGDTKCVNTE